MKEFNVKDYWQQRYVSGGNSGVGSEGDEALVKASIINHWIQEFGIKTISELGSGDGNNLLLYNIPISYTGFDISEKAIEICNEKTRKVRNSLKYYFTSELSKIDYDADLCLSLDVWYHLVDEQVFADYCDLLFVKGNWRYIIIYSTDTDVQTTLAGVQLARHLKFRKVMDKVKEFPQWEMLYQVSGFTTPDNQQVMFPEGKMFYLYKRKV